MTSTLWFIVLVSSTSTSIAMFATKLGQNVKTTAVKSNSLLIGDTKRVRTCISKVDTEDETGVGVETPLS